MAAFKQLRHTIYDIYKITEGWSLRSRSEDLLTSHGENLSNPLVLVCLLFSHEYHPTQHPQLHNEGTTLESHESIVIDVIARLTLSDGSHDSNNFRCDTAIKNFYSV
jgi:hypothetical protein